ncbi:MAG: prepilin-type N-terminal cleavage/methylation domain-containing protein [Planctomycetota bacterium]
MKPLGSRGFSLIELLVVIAVIALLVGIAVPAFGGAIRAARTTACLSNARQLAVAITVASRERDQMLPENRTLLNETQHVTWRHRLVEDGYAAAEDAWACPSHPGEPLSERGSSDFGSECVGDIESSYALNGHVLWRRDKTDDTAARREASIIRPSHTALMVETRGRWPDLRVTNPIVAANDELGGFYGFWHERKGTYAFADGHAETIGFMATGSPDCRWHNGRDFEVDAFDPQESVETGPHDHPDWAYLASEVYLAQ